MESAGIHWDISDLKCVITSIPNTYGVSLVGLALYYCDSFQRSLRTFMSPTHRLHNSARFKWPDSFVIVLDWIRKDI